MAATQEIHPTQRARDDYHALLAQEDVGALWETFKGSMQDNLLAFGDRPICNVLRPLFLHPQEYEFIAGATESVMGALHKVYRALRDGRLDMTGSLALSPNEAALMRIPDFYGEPDASARMDGFYSPGARLGEGSLKFLEYNADTPGGLAFGDVLGDLFLDLPVMQRFAQQYRLSRLPVREKVYDTLLACYDDWCRVRGEAGTDRPNIAIVDWRAVRTRHEFTLSAQVFERRGSRVVICDPGDLVYRDGRLWAVGGTTLKAGSGAGNSLDVDFPVDIVYKRVVVNEFVQAFDRPEAMMAHPLVRAVQDQVVCMVNSFNCQMLYNKAIFALISDEENAELMDADERAAVRAHIPWTRFVEDRTTRFQGQEVDLVDFVRRNKDDLVLKPVKEYGGTGVVLGWETEPDKWAEDVEYARNHAIIVQQRVPTPRTIFPICQDGELRLVERMVDIDPYVWRGRQVAHAGVRLGTTSLLNVSAGGGSAAPLFLVEKK